MIELGGNIKLVGFKELEPAQLIVIKKIVGNFAKKLNDHKGTFEELTLDLKSVHNSNHEIHGKIFQRLQIGRNRFRTSRPWRNLRHPPKRHPRPQDGKLDRYKNY